MRQWSVKFRPVAWLSIAGAIAIAGCGGPPAPTKPPRARVDPWVLMTIDPQAAAPALVTNGLVGLRIGRDGTGYGASGARLQSLRSDAFEPKGEEKILRQGHPFLLRWKVGGKPVRPEDDGTYVQSLDMRTGLLSTQWNAQGVRFECTTAIDPDARIVAQRWSLTSAWRTRRAELSAAPSGAYRIVQTGPTKAQVNPDKSMLVERVATLDKGSPPRFGEVAARSKKVWAERWKTDIVIDGPVEDQQAVRSFLYYVRASVHPKAGRAPGPMALSSDRYFGHVFWDADVWLLPALALIDPDAARTIPDYRLARAPAARRNYDRWIASGRPVSGGKLGGRTPEMPRWDGVMYPWESSVGGRETVPGPSRFEHHITGSVAWGLGFAADLGLADPKAVRRIRREAAAFYLNRITKRSDGLYSLKATMSPDENRIGDDDLYTNVLAQILIDQALARVSDARRPRLIRPQDATSLLNYSGDALRGYKQAAGVLAAYPLQDPGAEKQALALLARFAPLVSKNGPAMSDSVHAVLWARAGKAGNAYEAWRRSWVPFTRHPLMLFSEKRSLDATYFTTGAAGSIQTVLYGFLGIRIDSGQEHPSDWSKLLIGKARLTVKPQLPPSWKRVTLRGFTVLGRRYTLTATHDAVHVTEGDHD